jgi:predicted nucleotidyltransferase
MKSIALKKNEKTILLEIIKQHLPHGSVYAFGSRVTGKAKPFSDLDLAIVSEAPIPALQLYFLEQAFAESTLPFKVDLVEWNNCSEEFKKIIQSHWIKVWK